MPVRLFALMLAGLAAFGQSREKEAALGTQLALELRRNHSALEDAAAKAYVERLGHALAAQLPADSPPFTFELLADPGGPLQEPLVLPGGYVFVRAALFRTAENEAEFAGMLAHSMAHAAARHGLRQATRGPVINYASIPLVFMGSADGIHGNTAALPPAYTASLRDYELEADRIAAEAMAQAGYDPAALVRYIERLQPDTARLEDLWRAIAALPAWQYGTGTGGFERIRAEIQTTPAPKPEPPTLRRRPQ